MGFLGIGQSCVLTGMLTDVSLSSHGYQQFQLLLCLSLFSKRRACIPDSKNGPFNLILFFVICG